VLHHSNIPTDVAGNHLHVFASTGLSAHGGTTAGMVSGRAIAALADAACTQVRPFALSVTRVGGAITVVLSPSTVGSLLS
jgi:hypothetical protein